ncbi:xanthine dehydrogenase molybdopterin binding subunit [Methylobacterium brachythecii]|uniref:Xanthine dehydrogenase large subunit n=1 Tax=Methylobacterium brachythecii TaxID=1176177 RepID=A0A7W6F833_9HYPH|nr:xanthine dehydrogenase molybdopterin binding subunit [Methylobacterium brachythecii]MBB3904009.1 xanthine dehydrogenase large subunit [Methylobacterium brachythecii]GLS42750.1 xanthine dehydrogenase large subunit [Methylobacterium brachythecii]
MNKHFEPSELVGTPVAQVGISRPHESAHLHVSGRAYYTDDIPESEGTLHVALGLSPIPHGRLKSIDIEALRAIPGVVAVLTAADIPGVNDCGPVVHDDPIFAKDTVQYVGQPVFAVVATNRLIARRAAAKASKVLDIEPLEAVLDPREAVSRQSFILPPMHLTRGNPAEAMATAEHRLKGTLSLGGQEQFYLEGQIAYATPADDGGVKIQCSTQHPSEMQLMASHALGVPANRVHVECRRMGGGFGGKESQSGLHVCVVAMAAAKLNRPVKLRLDRDDDFMITGRRHGFEYDYEVGFDATGLIIAADLTMISNCGFSTDLSGPVMTRAICHFDNAYWLPNVAIRGYTAKTNTQSNTAFRGFGGPQGAFAIEAILDRVAGALNLDPVTVRHTNFYGRRQNNVTPYGQVIVDNVIHELTGELLRTSGYWARREAIERFNASSPVLKKGINIGPCKFGISFNLTHLNQAGALVHVYTDGSIIVNHGGTEMGQGLNTKVAQVVAEELGVRFERVRSTATDTQKIANTSATAASTGADLNGKAAQDAARQIRRRLEAFASQIYGGEPEDVVLSGGRVQVNGTNLSFEELVAKAYVSRIQLWSDGFYATPEIHWDRETMSGNPFYYYAYGAAISEVMIDTLTGEWRLVRADVLHDAGRSLNPALDVGQVEGGFVQSMGWVTSEELVWHPKNGKLLTHAPSTYKIPTANDVPAEFTTRLFKNENVKDSIFKSKAVGEPPMLLGFSVWLAVRDAVRAAGGPGSDPVLDAPCTPEAILMAVQSVKKPAAVA